MKIDTGKFELWAGRPYFHPKSPLEWHNDFKKNKDIDSLVTDVKNHIISLQSKVLLSSDILSECSASCAIEKISTPSEYVDNYYNVLEAIGETKPKINTDTLLSFHKQLMVVDKRDKKSGKFRDDNVRINNPKWVFYPAPSNILVKSIDEFIEFANHRKLKMDSIVKAAIAHAYFEVIHPYLDGNGRMGRILILWMLMNDEVIDFIELSPSVYFLKNQDEYYDRLNAYSLGDVEGWVKFFLKALLH